MEQFAIRGGQPLAGSVTIAGSKNAALGILAGAILSDEDVYVRNIPAVSDVEVLIDTIRDIGATVEQINRHEIKVNGSTIRSHIVDNSFIRKMRGGYYLLGALLGKYRFAEVAQPGGCTIGSRPIDQHLKGFEALGAETVVQNSMICAKADRLVGSHVFFDSVSVGATINLMLAAVFAEGRTILENVAKEPHVVDVANFLNSMGAKIKGAGTDVIRIDGVRKLHGTDYTVIPDQIEAGTFMVAAAMTKGDVLIKNVIPKHMECISSKLQEIGCRIEEYDDAIRVIGRKNYRPARVKTMPYPGFPTDMQPQITVLLSTVSGTSMVTETIFENRFKYVDELARMGANISVKGNTAILNGVQALTGAQIVAPDLRAGAALVIAALAARGDSIVEDVHFILRGYEDLVLKFKELGGIIETVNSKKEAEIFLLSQNVIA